MWRYLLCTLAAVVLLAGRLPALEVRGVVKKVDVERRMLVLTAGQQDHTIHVPEGVKVLDAAGQELPDGLRAKDLREAATVTLSVDRQDGKMTLRAIRLGAAPGGKVEPRGALPTAPNARQPGAPLDSAWEPLPDGSFGQALGISRRGWRPDRRLHPPSRSTLPAHFRWS